MTYLWVKAFHIIAVISWMAGLLYLPRLFVYHCQAAPGSPAAAMLEVMESRLLRLIMNPALVAVYAFGIWMLVLAPEWLHEPWFHAKLTLVLAMTAVHHLLATWRKRFAAGQNRHSERFYRIINEVPTVLMIAIVILVVVKPF